LVGIGCRRIQPGEILPLNYRTVSGSDRMLDSTGGSLEEVMSEQDLINAVAYVCMTKAKLDLDQSGEVERSIRSLPLTVL